MFTGAGQNKVGVEQPYISRVENGKQERRLRNIETLAMDWNIPH